jgi:hypothetical protein
VRAEISLAAARISWSMSSVVLMTDNILHLMHYAAEKQVCRLYFAGYDGPFADGLSAWICRATMLSSAGQEAKP